MPIETYVDPKTGFTVTETRNSTDWERPPTSPQPAASEFADIAQGQRGEPAQLDPARFSDHQYWLEHKNEIIAAAERGLMEV